MNTSPALIQTIQRKLKKGFPAGEIEQELLESGLPNGTVKQIMEEAVQTKYTAENSAYQKVSSIHKLVASCSIIVGIALLSLNSSNSFGMLLVAVGCLLLLPIFYTMIQQSFKRKEEI